MENANLTTTGLKWLNDAARWARFIAIIGFISIGFMVLAGIIIGPVLSYLNQDMMMPAGNTPLSSSWFALFYIIFSAIYFFPIYFLYQFSNKTIVAYKAKDEEMLNASFVYLKRHFKFIGILIIIVIALYILIFAGLIIAAIAGVF